ncbi:hypothetical protein WR25_09338 [Diploscapter pachys]|uniref:Uncharacterized protein n=1 Tax=Diploscapter pachys TaxID=2018661 RepID=A0A2A2L525_9BILA|nr:hypothetical protein WR25_09338 [Diploscapter pachys]
MYSLAALQYALICAYLFGENAALSIRVFLDPFEGLQSLQSLANHSPRASLEVVWAHATTQFSAVDHLQSAHSCNMHIVLVLLFSRSNVFLPTGARK